jgi:hypothetical protein
MNTQSVAATQQMPSFDLPIGMRRVGATASAYCQQRDAPQHMEELSMTETAQASMSHEATSATAVGTT